VPESWLVRRATLASLPRKVRSGIRLSEHLDSADGEAVFRHACAMRDFITARLRPLLPAVIRRGQDPDVSLSSRCCELVLPWLLFAVVMVGRRGVTDWEGLYFLGLRRTYAVSSALLAGVGNDAAFLADHIAGRH
jgi:hypothetical protein